MTTRHPLKPLELDRKDVERLAALFPGVPIHQAATALLLDAIEQAEAINRKDER